MKRAMRLRATTVLSRGLGGIAVALLALIPVGPSSITAVQSAAQPQIDLPTIPDPVPVSLEASSTALVLADFASVGCAQEPGCAPLIAPLAELLGRARAAGVRVVYTSYAAPAADELEGLPQLRPLSSEPFIARASGAANWAGVDGILADYRVKTLILTGFVANNVVMYGASILGRFGYTIVVPEDGIGARSDFDLFLAKYQMLYLGNPTNEPLRPNAVTLSRTDLISFD